MRSTLALTSLLALAACVSSDYYVRNGVTVDRYQRDTIACATQVSQAVPSNTQVAWAPYVGIYSVDTNRNLRDGALEVCMRDHGYQKVKLPYCTGASEAAAVARSKAPRDLNRVMSFGKGSCWVSGPDGQPFLYTPG